MKRLIALMLVVIMCISAFCFTAQAGDDAPYRMGDLDGDGKITAKDSLLMRKAIVGVTVEFNALAADIDGDGSITAADSFLLRKHLAQISFIDPTPITDRYLSVISIYGVSIDKYNIVIPENADMFEGYAADILADYIYDKSGITVDIVDDTTEPSPYEFLIGDTNREESIEAASACTLASDEYLLKADGFKIVMLGESYMIGGGVGRFTYDFVTYDSSKKAQVCEINNLPVSNAPEKYVAREANNAILMIGDGMGPNHAVGTLFYNNLKGTYPDYTEFYATRLPVIGQVMTGSVDTEKSGGTTPTDSAAAGTALASGIKTLNKYIGLDRNKNPVQNIREASEAIGKKTGVMATEPMTGATPGAFTVHIESRSDIEGIAAQQAAITDIEYMKGDVQDAITEETIEALDILSTNNDDGFFIMIEESNIDTWSHKKDRDLTLHCMQRFNKAVAYAMVFAVSHPDTLLIITADHETGAMTIRGGLTSDSHTTANVPIYAIGDGSQSFIGTVDNTLIPKVIAREFGIANFGG